MLDVDVQRSICIEFELVPVAYREPIDRVRHLKAFVVVHCEGPESAGGRRFALLEMHDMLVSSVEGLSVAVNEGGRIDRVGWQIGAKPSKSDDGSL
jgi:hypothetical protein